MATLDPIIGIHNDVDALLAHALKVQTKNVPMRINGTILEHQQCFPCSTKEEAWEMAKTLREDLKKNYAAEGRQLTTTKVSDGSKKDKRVHMTLKCDMKHRSRKRILKTDGLPGPSSEITAPPASVVACSKEEFDASGIEGTILHAQSLSDEQEAVCSKFPSGTTLWGLTRHGKTSGTRSKSTRKIYFDVQKSLKGVELMDMDAKEAAAAVLADESYGAGTKLLQELRVKLNKNMFPVAVAPTAAMLAGIAAEERINRDKELKKKVTDVLKEKYLSSFRFNNSNDHKPVVASDDVVLQGHQPITFHSSVKDVVGSIDFDYNSDCVIELKHAEKTYNLKDPVAASKGLSKPVLTTNADGTRPMAYKATGWKKHVDQCQHNMLVKGYKKAILLLTDFKWRMVAIDIVADPKWQKTTLFAAQFVSELSKQLIPLQYLPEGGIGVRVPSYEECLLSSRGLTVTRALPRRDTATKKTTECPVHISFKFFNIETWGQSRLPRGLTPESITETGLYITSICCEHQGCKELGETDRTTKAKTERTKIAAELYKETTEHRVSVDAMITKMFKEKNIVLTKKKARNLIQKGEKDSQRAEGIEDIGDHDLLIKRMDEMKHLHYVMKLEERDSETGEALRTFTVMKVGATEKEVEDESPYYPKKVLVDDTASMRGPKFFSDWSVYEYITGAKSWPHSAEESSKVDAEIEKTAASSELFMISLAYTTTEEMKEGARFPESMGYDTTCRTNTYEYKLAFVSGCNSSWKSFNFLGTILNREQSTNFEFVFNLALPLMYGSQILSFVHNIASDGDDVLIKVIDNAINCGCFTNAFRRRCYWHMVTETYNKDYAKKVPVKDDSVGPIVQKCVKPILGYTECEDEFQKAWDELLDYVAGVECIDETFTTLHKQLLNNWLTYVYNRREFVAEASTTAPFLQYIRSTGRNEGEHSAVKHDGRVNNMTKLHRMMALEMGRILHRTHERELNVASSLRKTKFSALELAKTKKADVACVLNSWASSLLADALKNSSNYKCKLLENTESGGIRILVFWDPDVTQRPSKTWKLPISISPMLKPRIVTLVRTSTDKILLACECRDFLNRQFVCPHHLCVNGKNMSASDIHKRYWKPYAAGHFDSVLATRKLSSFRQLGAELHKDNVLGLNPSEIISQCISETDFVPSYGGVTDESRSIDTSEHLFAPTFDDNENSDDDLEAPKPTTNEMSNRVQMNLTDLEAKLIMAVRATAINEVQEYADRTISRGKQAKKNYKTLTAIRKEGVDLCGEDWEAYRDLAMIEPICQTFLRQAKQARSKRTNSGRSKTRNNIISDSTVITKRGGRSSNKRTRGSHEGKKKSKKRKRGSTVQGMIRLSQTLPAASQGSISDKRLGSKSRL